MIKMVCLASYYWLGTPPLGASYYPVLVHLAKVVCLASYYWLGTSQLGGLTHLHMKLH